MANGKIHYAVIALNKKEAEEVVEQLKKENKEKLAEWLEANKDRVYGDNPDEWKPFNKQNITQLISNTNYVSETPLIYQVIEDHRKIYVLDFIEVYFIDMFAIFLEKFEELATRLDKGLGSAKEGKCCILIYYGLSKEIQDELEAKFCDSWPAVYNGYKKGCLHRIAVRADDINNFRNYLLNILKEKDSMSQSAERELDKQGWKKKPLEKLGG